MDLYMCIRGYLLEDFHVRVEGFESLSGLEPQMPVGLGSSS